MKLTLEHVDVRSTDALDSMVEERILALETRVEIEEARVRLERTASASPPFRVAVHLVTPGPDLRVDERDHTISAAVNKAVSALEEKLVHKRRKQMRRVKSNLQEPITSRSLRG